MKKTQAAFGMLACLVTGSAMAQTSVTAAGLVDAFAGSLKYSGDAGRRAVVNSGGMTTSWFGFKGVEDLGSGLKADFALTGFFQSDTGTSGRFGGDNLFSRDANIGLSGGFGRVQLGRGLAPSFLPTILFNPFGDSFTFSPAVLHAYVPSGAFGARTWTSSNAGDSGWSNQIIYTTPTFGGFKANLHYQLGEVAGATDRKNIAINGLYFAGPIGLTAFYHDIKVSNPNAGAAIIDPTAPVSTINRQKGAGVGGSYDLKVVKLFATYQQNKDDTATVSTALKDKTYTVGASAPIGPGTLMAAYANTKRTGPLVGAERERDTASLGYDYFISKRTDLYAVYMNDKISTASRESSYAVGVRHRF